MSAPKVFVWVSGRYGSGDVVCAAIAEDGTSLAGHLSSNESWARHDMGLTSDWKHDNYSKHYPDGFEVVWVDEPKTHVEFNVAYRRHVEKYAGQQDGLAGADARVRLVDGLHVEGLEQLERAAGAAK